MSLDKAIAWKYPDAQAACDLDNNKIIEWRSPLPKPDEAELLAEYEPVGLNKEKISRVHEIIAKKVATLSDPLDSLRMTVITGLQGDRTRGNPLDVSRQNILDAAEADSRKVMAEELLIAADDIIANIDTIEDIDQAFIDRNII